LAVLDLTTFRQSLDAGAVLVDTRPVEAWAAGHLPGALANPLRDQFASWLGWLVERDQPVLFVIGADQDRAELVRQCHQIGYDCLVGELAGGTTAWAAADLPLRRTTLVDATRLDGPVLGGRVLDVRQDSEHAAGHIPGAAHIELGRLAPAAAGMAPVEVVMCGHGERAATAASILERAGQPGVTVVVGGPADWAAATGRRLATR
ncbi:MAG: rhodanese-like domain-containing protein, partial [Acidimicrobiia bacterium]